jgi:hypothetical protein
MIVHVLDGIEYLHIKDFSDIMNVTIQAVRQLCFKGNKARCLKHIYEGSRIYIEKKELEIFPFMKGGHGAPLKEIYHFRRRGDGQYEKYICEACTQGPTYDHDDNLQILSSQ